MIFRRGFKNRSETCVGFKKEKKNMYNFLTPDGKQVVIYTRKKKPCVFLKKKGKLCANFFYFIVTVNVYHASFDDVKVLPKDGCHHQKGGEHE